MENTTGQILKNTDVELNGQIQIDIAKNAPSQTQQQPNQTNTGAKPKAIIVENSPDSVVIEFTCSCGTKTYLQCGIANNQ